MMIQVLENVSWWRICLTLRARHITSNQEEASVMHVGPEILVMRGVGEMTIWNGRIAEVQVLYLTGKTQDLLAGSYLILQTLDLAQHGTTQDLHPSSLMYLVQKSQAVCMLLHGKTHGLCPSRSWHSIRKNQIPLMNSQIKTKSWYNKERRHP